MFDELGWLFPGAEGRRYASVSVDVENTSADPVAALVLAQAARLDLPGLASIELSDGPRALDPSVLRTSDSLMQRSFQPGLPINVVLVWQQDAAEAAPEEVSIAFSSHTWRRSAMDNTFGWHDPVAAARTVLPLDQLEEAP